MWVFTNIFFPPFFDLFVCGLIFLFLMYHIVISRCVFLGHIVTNMLLRHLRRTPTVSVAQRDWHLLWSRYFFFIVPNTKLLCNWQEKVPQLDPLYTAMTPAHLTVQCVVLPRCYSQSLKVFLVLFSSLLVIFTVFLSLHFKQRQLSDCDK